jgi:hypothetical protein
MLKIRYFLTLLCLSSTIWADNTCTSIGGKVEPMEMIYNTSQGSIKGFIKKFCVFTIDNGYAVIGLSSMNSSKPNIAASYVKTLGNINESSPLWLGDDSNPSHNVCKNLGGTVSLFAAPGSFTSTLGENDVCVFGDGSMISGWTLIYIANERDGYHLIKDNISSPALPLFHP